jgi:HD-like signal output (HDOD) protein
MGRVSQKDLQPGMKLAHSLEDRSGRLLMTTGTELTERHIRSLKLWGIMMVDIEGDDGESAASGSSAPLGVETLAQAKALTAEAFRHNLALSAHPLIKELMSIYMTRMARELEKKDSGLFANLSGSADMTSLALYATAASKGLGISEKPSLNALVHKTETLASPPAIYNEIITVVNDPRSSATDVANVISGDPGLTARLLRLVNSAFYGFPGKVETVTRAITLVGMNELSELAMATSVMKSFSEGLGRGIDTGAFWRHSLGCGVLARLFAEQRHEPNSERYFVTGLLHDIGRLVIISQLPRSAADAIRKTQIEKKPLSVSERECMGFTHAEVGRELLARWNLPEGQRQAIAQHHSVGNSDAHYTEIAITHVSDVISHVMRIGWSGEPVVAPLDAAAWDHLGLQADILPALTEEAEMQVKDLAGVFDLDKGRKA